MWRPRKTWMSIFLRFFYIDCGKILIDSDWLQNFKNPTISLRWFQSVTSVKAQKIFKNCLPQTKNFVSFLQVWKFSRIQCSLQRVVTRKHNDLQQSSWLCDTHDWGCYVNTLGVAIYTVRNRKSLSNTNSNPVHHLSAHVQYGVSFTEKRQIT